MINKKLHILIAIESFYDGGAEMFAIRLANELAHTQKVYFVELYPERSVEKRQLPLLKEAITLFQVGVNARGNEWLTRNWNKLLVWPAKNKRSASPDQQVISFIRKNKISVVNSHSWDSDVYFAGLKDKTDFKLVSTFHGHYDYVADKREKFDDRTAASLKRIDEVVYTSPQQKLTLDKFYFPKERRHKIFYGISSVPAQNTTTFREGECLRLVMVARGIKEKGWEAAIEAVLQLDKKYPGILKLHLVGEGDCLDELMIKYPHPAIHFAGYLKNVKPVVEEAHIGLLPTTYIAESLPNSVIEYLFCGKPVVTTNAGAIKEMITVNNNVAGICIQPVQGKVITDCLASAIENYILNPGLIEEHSKLALQAAEKFIMEKCVSSYREVFTGRNANHD